MTDDPGFHMLRSQQQAYWRKTMGLTAVLLLAWVVITFVVSYLTEWLNQWSLFGFPLGYFMGAQGGLLIYLLLAGSYSAWMNRLDRQFGVDEQ